MNDTERIEDLTRRVDGLEAAIAILAEKTDAQTRMLEKIEGAVTGVLSSPRVRSAVVAGWTTLWVAFTGWLAARGHGVPP
jgi:hypothetical protein